MQGLDRVLLGFEKFHAEGMGKKRPERGLLVHAVFSGIEDQGIVVSKLGQGLAAGPAGHGRRMVQVRYGDRAKADSRSVFSDRACDGALFGATSQPVGTIFDVAAGNGCAIG